MYPDDSAAPSMDPGSSTNAQATELHPWYAIRVRPNFERSVSASLRSRGYTDFVPFYRARRRWSDRTKLVDFPLFPGYVFCRFDPRSRLPVLQIPGVVNVVGFGNEFVPIDDAEIESIQAMVSADCGVQPWPFLRAGQKVKVRSGALKGVEGLLVSTRDLYRLVVSINILQRSVAAEIDRLDVEPVF